jgi:hypothetical protein
VNWVLAKPVSQGEVFEGCGGVTDVLVDPGPLSRGQVLPLFLLVFVQLSIDRCPSVGRLRVFTPSPALNGLLVLLTDLA